MKPALLSLFKSTLFQSVIFWTVSYIVLLNLFATTDSLSLLDYIYSFLFHIPLVLAVGLHYWAVMNFLEKRRFGLYLNFAILGLLVAVFLYPFTFDTLAPILFYEFFFVTVYEWHEFLGIVFIYFFATLLLRLSFQWFSQQAELSTLAQIKEEKTKSDLRALRAQINPHFLFNTLNTIYGEALKNSKLVPELILSLSDLLRYVVDQMNEEKVDLKREVGYLEKFISLQKMRLESANKVTFNVEGNPVGLKISPLLLATFVENCFKHGDLNSSDSFIEIKLKVEGETILFTSKNSVLMPSANQSSSGNVGIENVKQRLLLNYPENHTLSIHTYSKTFEVHLKLKLS